MAGIATVPRVSIEESPTHPSRFTPERLGLAAEPDDTGTLQRMLNAIVKVPDGLAYINEDYVISDTLTIAGPCSVHGANRQYTRIRQTGADKHGIRIQRDTANGNTLTQGIWLKDFMIQGVGKATATGTGLIGQDTDVNAYQGGLLTCDLKITGWDTDVRLHRWDNVRMKLHLDDANWGYVTSGNANSHKIRAIIANITNTGFQLGEGSYEIHLEDAGKTGKFVDVQSLAVAILHGGNFEICYGSDAFIHVRANGRLVSSVSRFLRNGGSDIPGYLVEANGSLQLLGIPQWSGFTTAKPVRKVTSGSVVTAHGAWMGLSSAPELIVDEVGVDSYPAMAWPTRSENSVPTINSNTRGLTLGVMARTASNTEDELLHVIRDRSSGLDAFQARTLTATIRGTGSPEGVVAARPGTMYLNKSGGAGTTLYVKETGNGNTGWAAK